MEARLGRICGWLLVVITLGSTGGAMPQANRVSPPLDRVVSIRVNHFRLGDLCVALSRQTGIDVQPAPCIREHTITLSVHNLALSSILRSLHDLYGWAWHADGRTVVIDRPGVRQPSSPLDLANCIGLALPLDLRTLVGFRLGRAPTGAKGTSDALEPDGPSLSSRRENALYELERDLRGKLPASGEIPIRLLSDSAKDHLARFLTLDALVATSARAIAGDLKPFERDFQTATIHIQDGNVIWLGVTSNQGGGRSFDGLGTPLVMPARKPSR
jgi:hypothetical protein